MLLATARAAPDIDEIEPVKGSGNKAMTTTEAGPIRIRDTTMHIPHLIVPEIHPVGIGTIGIDVIAGEAAAVVVAFEGTGRDLSQAQADF